MTQFPPATVFAELLGFLDRLEAANIHYDVKHVRDSLMVLIAVPNGYWEIEFFADGTLEAEHFPSEAGVDAISPTWLDQFIADQA
jgi:hypothetical protein